VQEHNNSIKKHKNTLKQLNMLENHGKMDYLVEKYDYFLGSSNG
jgi:hypothetical protein